MQLLGVAIKPCRQLRVTDGQLGVELECGVAAAQQDEVQNADLRAQLVWKPTRNDGGVVAVLSGAFVHGFVAEAYGQLDCVPHLFHEDR